MAYIPRHAKAFDPSIFSDEDENLRTAPKAAKGAQNNAVPTRRDLFAGGVAALLAGALTTKPTLAYAAEGDEATQEDIARLAYEIADLEQSISLMDNRMGKAETDLAKVGDVSDKFPLTESDIADNTIGFGKLSDEAKADIIQGIRVRHFNNLIRGADNEGMICPADGNLAGFYVPELTLLVITRYEKAYGRSEASWHTDNTSYRLPSYVPRVTENLVLAPFGVVSYYSNQSYKDWHGFGLNPNGFVGGSNYSDSSEGRILVGTVAVFLRPYISE